MSTEKRSSLCALMVVVVVVIVVVDEVLSSDVGDFGVGGRAGRADGPNEVVKLENNTTSSARPATRRACIQGGTFGERGAVSMRVSRR